MTKTPAAYFDGTSARRHRVQIIFDDQGSVRVDGEGVHGTWPFDELRISARLGNTPRYVYLPDGGKCEIEDNDLVDMVVARRGGSAKAGWLHRLESRWTHVALAVVAAIGVGWATIEFVVPWAAQRIAYAIPPAMESSMGAEGLQTLDRLLFQASKLPIGEQERIRALFASLIREARDADPASGTDEQALELTPRLELRASPSIGANAFALPGGIVVITDELARLVDDDEALLAVMAHELGHHAHRHVLRGLLQSSMTALFVAVAFGDLSSISGLSATLPTYLADAKYSREFELEADRFAADYLDRTGRSRAALARVLGQLAEAHGEGDSSTLDYLSSHPATRERIDALSLP